MMKPQFAPDYFGNLKTDLLRAIADPGMFPEDNNPKGDRTVSEWSRDAVIKALVNEGHVLPGKPPAAIILADAMQFAEQLILANLTARLLRFLTLGPAELPYSGPAKDWIRDYLDGVECNGYKHGPIGKPMVWPGNLLPICAILRDWGFEPTATVPPYVRRKVNGE